MISCTERTETDEELARCTQLERHVADLERRVAELEEWIAELADDLLERTQAA